MLQSVKRMIINTPAQPFVEQAVLHPAARLRALARPGLRRLYLDDIHLDRAIERLVEPGFNCVDVGCHIGSVLAKFVRLAPGGEHAAFEPTPDKAARLRRKFPDIEIHELALSDEPGEADFFINAREAGYNSLNRRGDGREGSEKITVKIGTLDESLPPGRRIDVLKIDAEGAELGVIKGGERTMSVSRPLVIFESGPARPLEAGGFAGDALFRHFTDALEYAVYTPETALSGGAPMSLETHRAHRTYPFGGFNFIALPS